MPSIRQPKVLAVLHSASETTLSRFDPEAVGVSKIILVDLDQLNFQVDLSVHGATEVVIDWSESVDLLRLVNFLMSFEIAPANIFCFVGDLQSSIDRRVLEQLADFQIKYFREKLDPETIKLIREV